MSVLFSIWPHASHTSAFCGFIGCLLNLPSVVSALCGPSNKWTASLRNNENFCGPDKDQSWPRALEAAECSGVSGLLYRQINPLNCHSQFSCSKAVFSLNIWAVNVLFKGYKSALLQLQSCLCCSVSNKDISIDRSTDRSEKVEIKTNQMDNSKNKPQQIIYRGQTLDLCHIHYNILYTITIL